MHLGVGTVRRVGIVLLILAMAWILSLETRAQKVKIKPEAPQPTKGQGLFKTEKYDLLTLAMHEVYEHYNQAQDYFKKQNYDLAGANLRVMEFYLSGTKNILPDQITVWEKDKPAKTITLDKAKYIATVDRLNHYSQQVQAGLAKGQWLQAGGNQPDPMMETCVGCHLSNQVPTSKVSWTSGCHSEWRINFFVLLVKQLNQSKREVLVNELTCSETICFDRSFW